MAGVSIIIPTNRPWSVLKPCLDSVAAQQFPLDEVEVLIVWNGHLPPHPVPHRQDWPFVLHTRHLPEANIAAAKNAALEIASGEWIVLLNDDVVLEPGFLAAHRAAHRALDRPGMVLGEAAWARYPDQTVFDELIERTPMIFFYPRMRPHGWHNFRHAWNLNLSLPRRWLTHERFDERLGPFFYEDLELAWRLEKRLDAQVWYEPGARCTHHHRYTLTGYLERERAMGAAAVRLWRANPDCFRAIYNTTLDAAALTYLRRFVETESRQEAAHRAVLQTLVEQPAASTLPAVAREAWLELLYHAHLPLKRLAFRRGLLEACHGAAGTTPAAPARATASPASVPAVTLSP